MVDRLLNQLTKLLQCKLMCFAKEIKQFLFNFLPFHLQIFSLLHCPGPDMLKFLELFGSENIMLYSLNSWTLLLYNLQNLFLSFVSHTARVIDVEHKVRGSWLVQLLEVFLFFVLFLLEKIVVFLFGLSEKIIDYLFVFEDYFEFDLAVFVDQDLSLSLSFFQCQFLRNLN